MNQSQLDTAIANRSARAAAQLRYTTWTSATQKTLADSCNVRAPAFAQIQAIALADCKAEIDALDTQFAAL